VKYPIINPEYNPNKTQIITPQFVECSKVASLPTPIVNVNVSGRIYKVIKTIVGVNNPLEINNCHFKVDSIFSAWSTVIICVANTAVAMQHKIPAAESTKGYKKVASATNSTLVPETTYFYLI
jgi:hypothetical protein